VRAWHGFRSRALGRDVDVLVWLPPGYDRQRARRFPVLFLLDGQNVFDGATAFIPGEEWQADEMAQALVLSREIEPLILVAVANGGRDRVAEYTYTRDAHFGAGGRAEATERFLIDELKTFIDARFRTLPRNARTGICGSSLGGLLALGAALRHPDFFSRAAIVSPPVWWDQEWLLRRADGLERRLPLRLWLDTGSAEPGEAAPQARLLRDALERKGWRRNVDLAWEEAPGAQHNEAAWRARFGRILRWLYPPRGSG
jgi:predicted alpha/beta superfamily hydrolase